MMASLADVKRELHIQDGDNRCDEVKDKEEHRIDAHKEMRDNVGLMWPVENIANVGLVTLVDSVNVMALNVIVMFLNVFMMFLKVPWVSSTFSQDLHASSLAMIKILLFDNKGIRFPGTQGY
ncbi:hypothetical protein JTE90_027320 [Oedothorax gibbosus]|uniref:Uncharacterized protein n=1 Tax=Oedothorax gibbosus TaxID=931172 RepID=A0AAV6VYX3_9ARAC|nr:hypothetical protein JTE90_027320 [Oedothorax gibbosus]